MRSLPQSVSMKCSEGELGSCLDREAWRRGGKAEKERERMKERWHNKRARTRKWREAGEKVL